MIAFLLATAHHWRGHDGRWFPFFPFFPLVFLGLWIAVIATVGRRWRRPYRQSGEMVLAERYARGEIDETEYRERRAVLRRKD